VNEPKKSLDHDASWTVEASDGGRPIDGFLRARLDVSWGAARALVERGKVTIDGARVTVTDARLRAGQRVELHARAPRADRAAARGLDDAAIVHVDPHVVVARKPAGVSTVPYDGAGGGMRARAANRREEGEEITFEDLVRRWLVRRAGHAPQASLGVVHRIDKDTSGLLVFARTFAAKKALSQDFRAHAIERRYVAIVHGVVARAASFRSYLLEDRGDGLRGSARDPRLGERQGQLAITHVEPLEVLSRDAAGDGATAIACALETGRTHQIRIHLSEAAHPLAGDKVYTRDRLRAGKALLEPPRLMLHAAVLGFAHPITGEQLRFVDPIPDDVQTFARSLSGHAIEADLAAL
jgi:23S rRNA pseudouridine1911/1915/1917 synthase